MRARNIKPGFFRNEQLPDCDPLARLLFIGLWCMADKGGRLEDRPRKIKIHVLPCDNCDVDTLLSQLQTHGFILRYEVNGHGYLQIINFVKHQNPHHKEPASILPAPDMDAMLAPSMREKPRTRPSPALDPPQSILSDSLIPDSLIPESSPESDDAHAHEMRAQKQSRKANSDRKQNSDRTKLPYDTLPEEWQSWAAKEKGWSLQTITDVWECFKDYWQGQQSKSARKANWQATWRNWCHRQIIQKGHNHAYAQSNSAYSYRPSKSERARAAIIESAIELGYAPDERQSGQDTPQPAAV